MYIGIESIECINMAAAERSALQIFVRIVQDAYARENAIRGESLLGNIYLRSRGAKEHISLAWFNLRNPLHRASTLIQLRNPLLAVKMRNQPVCLSCQL